MGRKHMTEFEDIVWRLIRDEIAMPDFEQWVYAHPEIEGEVPTDLYLDLIQANFADEGSVWGILERWREIRYPGSYALTLCRDFVRTAKAILDGTLDVSAGAREISCLSLEPGVDDHDPDFLTFVYVDSEADDLAIGVDPQLLHRGVRRRRAKEIAEFKAWALETVREECHRLIARFGQPPAC